MPKIENFLPSFAKGHGCKPVDECEVDTLRSLGEGGYASAFAVRSRLRPTKVGGFRPTKRVEKCHGRKAVGLHESLFGHPSRMRRKSTLAELC
jgi:hypothetical protein